MGIHRPLAGVMQRRLEEWVNTGAELKNIEAYGDPLVEREEDDGLIRLGYQNIRTSELNCGFEITPEIDAMQEVGTDVQGMSEIKKPWTRGNRAV